MNLWKITFTLMGSEKHASDDPDDDEISDDYTFMVVGEEDSEDCIKALREQLVAHGTASHATGDMFKPTHIWLREVRLECSVDAIAVDGKWRVGPGLFYKRET